MTEQLQPDICVIGAGSAGLSVAGAAAVLGVPVVLIEKEDMASRADARLASSALIAAGRRTQAVRDSAAFGVDAMGVAIDFGAVRQHVNRVVNASAGDRSLQRLTALGIHVVNGSARFADRDSVIAGDYTIKARRFVIATGSAPLLPAIPGLDGVPFLTRETVFSLQDCPQHLLVIGSGAAALEFAQAFRRFGAAVTVLAAEQFLAAEDAECANIVLGRLAREGVVLRPAVTIARVSPAPGKITIVLTTDGGEETIEGSHVLVADGLRPVVEGLDLDSAGIQRSAAGIIVDERLRTTNKCVYAAGSVTGLPSAHAADYHAGLVIRNALFRFPARIDETLVPRAIMWGRYREHLVRRQVVHCQVFDPQRERGEFRGWCRQAQRGFDFRGDLVAQVDDPARGEGQPPAAGYPRDRLAAEPRLQVVEEAARNHVGEPV